MKTSFDWLTSARRCGAWIFEMVELGLIVVRLDWFTRLWCGLVIVVDNDREGLTNSRTYSFRHRYWHERQSNGWITSELSTIWESMTRTESKSRTLESKNPLKVFHRNKNHTVELLNCHTIHWILPRMNNSIIIFVLHPLVLPIGKKDLWHQTSSMSLTGV